MYAMVQIGVAEVSKDHRASDPDEASDEGFKACG